MLFICILISIFLIVSMQYKKLWKQRNFRELGVSSAIMGTGLILVVMRILHHPIPSPIVAITWVFKPVAQMMKQFLS